MTDIFKKNVPKVVAIFLLLLSFFAFIYYLNLMNGLDKYIKNDLVYVQNSSEFAQYTYPFQIDKSLPNKIVLLRNNWIRPFNPIVTLVFNGYPDEDKYQRIWTFELQKKEGFNLEYSIKRRQGSIIKKLSFDEIVELVSNNDITGDFPDKEKYSIINYPALSQSEIKKNQQKLEQEKQATQSNEEYKKYLQTTYGSLLKPYIEILELVKTDNITPQQIATNKQSASTKIKSLQTELQQIQTQLNNNQNYTLKDGVTITPTQQTKDYIQQFIDEMVKIKGENGIQ